MERSLRHGRELAAQVLFDRIERPFFERLDLAGFPLGDNVASDSRELRDFFIRLEAESGSNVKKEIEESAGDVKNSVKE